MANAEQQRLNAAIAPAQNVDWADVEMIDQCCQVVRHLFVRDLARTITGLTLVPAVHGDNPVVLAEVIDLGLQTAMLRPFPCTSSTGSPAP